MPTLKEIQDHLRNPAARKAGSKSLIEIVQAGRGALKHGLAGQMPVILPEDTLKVAAERQQRWRDQYQPDTPHEEFLFEHLCIDSVRLDQASRAVLAQEDEQALQARESWDFDRTLDAVRLAAGLHDRPEQVAMQLEQSLHGCRWLIAQWEEIREQVQEDKAWKTSVWTRTLNLLGVPSAGRERATSLLLGLGKSMQASLGLIDAKLLELRAKVREDLEARDARLRADTAMGLIAKPSPELKLARRYHRELVRRVQWYKSELLRLRQERLAPTREASSTDSTAKSAKSASSQSPKRSARPPETSAIVAPSTETSAAVAPSTETSAPECSTSAAAPVVASTSASAAAPVRTASQGQPLDLTPVRTASPGLPLTSASLLTASHGLPLTSASMRDQELELALELARANRPPALPPVVQPVKLSEFAQSKLGQPAQAGRGRRGRRR